MVAQSGRSRLKIAIFGSKSRRIIEGSGVDSVRLVLADDARRARGLRTRDRKFRTASPPRAERDVNCMAEPAKIAALAG